jgi:aldose 1-epimerase
MLGASLRHRHVEILRRVQDLEVAAAKGSTAGIPLLHPWANRLAGPRYRTAGREVVLDPSSPLLPFDEHGLPMHGVPWSLLAWELTEARQDRLAARLEWSRRDLLAVFPFRHRLELVATLGPDRLTLETTLVANRDGPVPVSFGFHPISGCRNFHARIGGCKCPQCGGSCSTGAGSQPVRKSTSAGSTPDLANSTSTMALPCSTSGPSFSIAGAGRRIIVDLLTGYAYAQIFAPKDKNYVALEPMTAPTNALTSGRGLQLVNPGGAFRAAFRIRIETPQ